MKLTGAAILVSRGMMVKQAAPAAYPCRSAACILFVGDVGMRMIAGAILILAATVLFAAQWLGQVRHNSTVIGSPEAGYITLAIVVLGIAGIAAMIIGFIADRKP